jgi:hypothetical protein
VGPGLTHAQHKRLALQGPIRFDGANFRFFEDQERLHSSDASSELDAPPTTL